ncbi:uncharacterized protein LOC121908068 [Scomber scombrus]|uniref:Uncharacterized protein LOC121908068 n=1 Tax=Scomber scombrus TaxID=13677 RepID=A0AAV1Q8E8_SCOSC
MEDEDLAKVEKFSCKFHGDFSLKKTPTTFQDAVQVYQSLPQLLGTNGENAVPMKVWLLPLVTLDSSAAQLVRQISIRLVQESQSVLEDFSELEMRCNDAIRTTTAQQFPQIGKKLKTFKEFCSEFKLQFQRTLAEKLPPIRGGGEEEAVLAEILKRRHSSPFNSKSLNEWMDCKEREICILKSYTKMMNNTMIVPSQNKLDEEILSAEHAVCFVFTSLGSAEPYLSALSNYLKQTPKPDDHQDQHCYDIEKEQCVTLKISPPRFGAENITCYFVEYCVSGEDGWKQTTAAKAEEVTVSGLTPNTEYMFRCRAVTSVGVGPAGEVCGPIKTLPCSPPGKPQVEPTSNEISVSWETPAEIGNTVHILSYILEYTQTDKGVKGENLHWNQMVSRAEKGIISGLQSGTEYTVRVRCDCGVAGRSKESITVNVCTTKCEFERLAEFMKHISKSINSGSPSLYKLPLTEEDLDIDGCRRYNLKEKENTRQNRTIMLLGATGSGKSTLINGMINFVAGVEWKDDFRFKLVDEDQSKSQAESQTSEVTVYKINHQDGFQTPFSLTIVDTPGFGDTRGIGRDKEITEQIRRLFTSKNGVSEIDAVCFVTQASLARLTATQRYVFDSVLSIFGKDVAENIQMLVTFADGKQPPVLEAINVSAVPCPKNDIGLPVHFKFNNSALFADNRCSSDRTCDEDSNEDDDDKFDEMFWNMGAKSMQKFFTALGQMETKSLLMTQEVLKERKHLEVAVEGLQPQVKAGLAKIEEIKRTKEKIKEHETVMTSNENFEIEVDIIKPVQKQLTNKGEFITNCQKCSMTCHYPCGIENDHEKRGCASMDGTGMCTVCPGKCIWSVHFNQTYRWEYVPVKEKQTLQELKNKYENATEKISTIHDLIERQEEEIVELQETIVSLMDQSAQCLTRLQEIALRPNPLTTPEYIDMLIEGEKSEAKEGYQARIQSLEAMRDKAKIISKVAKREKLTKTEEELSEEKKKRQEKKGLLKKVTHFFGF